MNQPTAERTLLRAMRATLKHWGQDVSHLDDEALLSVLRALLTPPLIEWEYVRATDTDSVLESSQQQSTEGSHNG